MLNNTKIYEKLKSHFEANKGTTLERLFEEDSDRQDRLTLEVDGLKLNYSHNLISEETLQLLLDLYAEADVMSQIEAMFTGQHINTTEDRAVLHTALRNVSNDPVMLDGSDVMPQINSVLERMRKFSVSIRSEQHRGFSNKPIKNIVNIGIGGSDLGPRMADAALRYYSNRTLQLRFVSNVDPADFYEQTLDLDPAETLFIVASKTFTTLETLRNAQFAKDWLLRATDDADAVSKHFVALSTNIDAVREFGINPENMFEFWDFVGGRYSLMSAIGLSLMISIGPENFDELRNGAYSMDTHFGSSDPKQNIPIILALIGVWYRNFYGFSNEAVLPYSQYLEQLPVYLQQLVMESNGKSVSKTGEALPYDTSPVVWGTVGTNNQHAYFQMLHQGTITVPIDMIGFDEALKDAGGQHRILNANMRAQIQAFAFGKSEQTLAEQGTTRDLIPHKRITGNKPVNFITAEKLTPFVLGQIIALYEHKTFVQGQIWGINSFDQFGVELGKEKALEILNS